MATAKKLPSGSWRCQVYDYTDASGKRHYQSFTCDDPSPKGKRLVQQMAANYAAERIALNRKKANKCLMTLSEAIDDYISTKDTALHHVTDPGASGRPEISCNQNRQLSV